MTGKIDVLNNVKDELSLKLETIETKLELLSIKTLFNEMFPVGSIYITFNNQYPPLHGEHNVQWELLPEGYAVMTANIDNTGSKSNMGNRLDDGNTEGHILTIEEMPKHSHDYVQTWTFKGLNSNNGSNHDNGIGKTSETGGNQPHSHKLKVANQKLLFWQRIS